MAGRSCRYQPEGESLIDILGGKLTEWQETVDEATRELDAIRRDSRWGSKIDELTIAIEEAELERDCAASELEMMREAHELLARVSPQLDAEGRATLAKVIEIVTDVDWPTPLDALATETVRLRKLRLRLPGRARNWCGYASARSL